VAVSKAWLYQQGGRPVIYDHPDRLAQFPESLKYRFCPYDPRDAIDFTWEREWRIASKSLKLDPNHTLVIVPTSAEAFEFVYQHASEEPEIDGSGSTFGSYHHPKWLAVSLDMFGVKYNSADA
jgi:hypothetical protein